MQTMARQVGVVHPNRNNDAKKGKSHDSELLGLCLSAEAGVAPGTSIVGRNRRKKAPSA